MTKSWKGETAHYADVGGAPILRESHEMERPAGVSAIAIVFGVAAAALFALGGIALGSPESDAIRPCALLLLGLLRAGAFIFFLCGIIAALVGWGLWRMRSWARWASMAIAVTGIVMLAPGVSSPALGWIFVASAVGLMARVMMVWYLWRDDVARAFQG